MTQDRLPSHEVHEQIKRAIRGEVKVAMAPFPPDGGQPELPEFWSWKGIYAGWVPFLFGDWKITIFNDCDSLDYVESAEHPDGRKGDYDTWAEERSPDNPEEEFQDNNPLRGLTAEDDRVLIQLLEGAR